MNIFGFNLIIFISQYKMFNKLPISLAAMSLTAGLKVSLDNSQLSIPACNTDKGCLTETASPWKL